MFFDIPKPLTPVLGMVKIRHFIDLHSHQPVLAVVNNVYGN